MSINRSVTAIVSRQPVALVGVKRNRSYCYRISSTAAIELSDRSVMIDNNRYSGVMVSNNSNCGSSMSS